MLRAKPFSGQCRIDNQRVISMDKGLFASRFPTRCSQTAEDDIDRVDHLRQGIGQLGIVGIKDTFRRRQRATRRRGDGADARLILQQPE